MKTQQNFGRGIDIDNIKIDKQNDGLLLGFLLLLGFTLGISLAMFITIIVKGRGCLA